MMLTPPCPKCSGVLRSLNHDASRCRCGYEVDGIHMYAARRLPESDRGAYLLTRGRMVPVPQHEPGIRVGRDAGALRDVGWDHRWEPWPAAHRLPEFHDAVAAAARIRGTELGLVHAGAAPASRLAPPGGRTLTEQHSMYGLAPAGAECDCARQMVDAIAAAHGPGRWWMIAAAVHVIIDDTLAPVCDIGGVPHVGMRSLYCIHAAWRGDATDHPRPAGNEAVGMSANRYAEPGFHRIGRVDKPGRGSLWIRESRDCIELCAGREGDDTYVKLTPDNPQWRDLQDVLSRARFAAEYEDSDGLTLDREAAERGERPEGAEEP